MHELLFRRTYSLVPADKAVRRRVDIAAEALFLICFAIYSFDMWMRISMYRNYEGPGLTKPVLDFFVWKLFIVCIAAKLLAQRYTLFQLIFLTVLGLGLWHVRLVSDDRLLFMTFCLFAAAQNIRLRPAAFVMVLVVCAVLVFSYGGFRAGLWGEQLDYRGGVERHSLGFGHPNSLARAMLFLYLAWFVLRANRITSGELLASIPIAVFIKEVTDSRTSLPILLLAALLAAWYKTATVKGECPGRVAKDSGVSRSHTRRYSKALALLAGMAFAGAFVMTMLLTTQYGTDNPAPYWFDSHLSGRIRLQNAYFTIADGCHLWGFDLNSYASWARATEIGLSGYLYHINLDSSYAALVIYSGVFGVCVVCLAMAAVVWRAFRDGGGTLTLSALLVVVLYSAFEYFLAIGGYNFVLPLAAAWVFYEGSFEGFESSDSVLSQVWLYRKLTGERQPTSEGVA